MTKLTLFILLLTIALSKHSIAQSYPRSENPNYVWTVFNEQFNSLSTEIWDIHHNTIKDNLYI